MPIDLHSQEGKRGRAAGTYEYKYRRRRETDSSLVAGTVVDRDAK